MPLLLSMSLGLWIFNITLMGVWALSICMFLYIVSLDVVVLPTFWDLELMQSVSKFWVLSLIYAHLPILLLLDQWICQLIWGLFAEKGGKQRSDDVFVNDLRLYCYVFFNDFFGLITWVCLFFFFKLADQLICCFSAWKMEESGVMDYFWDILVRRRNWNLLVVFCVMLKDFMYLRLLFLFRFAMDV